MMQHEAAQLVRQTHQGTLAGLDPTHPSVEASMEAIWEKFCEWHRDYWGWTPTKAQKDVKTSYAEGVWLAYQAGVTLRAARLWLLPLEALLQVLSDPDK